MVLRFDVGSEQARHLSAAGDHIAGVGKMVRPKSACEQPGKTFKSGMAKKLEETRELAARAICRMHEYPEDIKFEGKPMWMSYLPEVDAVLKAIEWKPEDRASGGSSAWGKWFRKLASGR